MPFVPVADTAEVEAVFLLDSQIVEMTFYYQNALTPDLSTLTNLLDAVNAAIRTSLLPFLSSAIQLLRVVGTLLDVADGLTAVSIVSLPAAGGDGSESAPSNVAACISKRTGQSGRSFRGRNYIPAIPNSAITTNTLSGDFTGGVTTAFGSILGAGGEDGWVPVVVSRFSGFTIVDGRKVPTPRETGIATQITSHFFVDDTVDSQRRRLPGRGR